MNTNNLEPAEKVVPLKVNAFEALGLANTQLAPMFPYVHPGAIIPCLTGFEGGPDVYIGYFVHENSVDEVGLMLGSSGRLRSGEVWVGPRKHGVGFNAPHPYFSATVITQRQKEEGEQPETIILQCEKCNEILLEHTFSAAESHEGTVQALPTTVGSLEGVMILEKNPEQRICPKCGHDNPAFPLDVWNWNKNIKNTRIAENALKALKEAVG